jgi:hypothetical protein
MKLMLQMKASEDTKIYLYAGGDESETMIEHVKSLKTSMLSSRICERQGKNSNLSINKLPGLPTKLIGVMNF